MPFAGEIHFRKYFGGEDKRPPLVLIHGAGGSYLHWPTEIRRMAGENVLALDLPGHGKSTPGGEDTIAGYTARLVDFLDQLNIADAVFAGHSMGGAILLNFVLDHPDRVKGLILVGSGAKLGVNPDLIRYCSQEDTYPEVVSLVVKWSFSPAADRRLVELARGRMADTPYKVVLRDFYACDAFDLQDRLREIEARTLLICGADDKMTPARLSQSLAKDIAESRLEIVADAGHMVMLERPRVVAGLIKEFLDELFSDSTATGELAI